jgi:lipoprotein NlpD
MSRIAGLALLALLTGCGVAPRAVVVDRNPPPQRPTPTQSTGSEHIVQRGDTLYGIAFRHGLDYRQVASWNGIPAPYTIYPGQRIRLHPGTGARPAVAGTSPAASRPSPASTPATPAPTSGSGSAPSPTPVSGAPSTPATPAPNPTQVPSSPPPATPPPGAPPSAPVGAMRWQWPTAGQVVSRFVAGDPTRQGVSIVGSAGQPVNAAADGVVVYSGSGLIGYGELVIVKHNDEFLSAYGHNRRRLVAEGEQVKAGQQIAEMGRSGAARDMLHFEIRRNGRPVDPLGFLPAR